MTDAADPAAAGAGSRVATAAAPAPLGLDAAAVRARVAAGEVNRSDARPSRTLADILRANVLTRFNAILGGLLVIVAVVGPVQDGLFGVVLVTNAAIGIIQELRAKRALDHLALLNAPRAHVVRDGVTADLPGEEVVLDDVVVLKPGDQLVADGTVLESRGLQLDESLLSGESEPVDKRAGDEVLSGSFVVAGSGTARIDRIGAQAYAQRLQSEAKRYAASYSELQQAVNAVLRGISWVIPPVAALLVTSQLLRSGATTDEALRGVVAGIAAMVPEGLVLLTTIAFAVGALRLAARRVLVQSLPAIESLARVDVLCIDKTGTLTAPGMAVVRIDDLGGDGGGGPAGDGVGPGGDQPGGGGPGGGGPGAVPPSEVLGALAAADPAPNATMQAIAAACPAPSGWELRAAIAFSSERKWSATEFAGRGSFVLGAPDLVLPGVGASPAVAPSLRRAGEQGLRALLLARSPQSLEGEQLPPGLQPLGVVLLAERIRPDAAATVAFLLEQGVEIKVISGDAPVTVASVASRVGIDVSAASRDATSLGDDTAAFTDAVATSNVFGRVRPSQKRAFVEALQQAGHVVAMTGDGVNDLPALKQADVGIAMGTGSEASRAVANIVLLDSEFAAVPEIVAEGRRVIANIERVASLFITKTAYALLVAVVVGAVAVPYPFLPRELTVVSSLTIGIPGFFLALAPGAPRARPHFLRRVLRFSVPAGLAAATAALAVYALTGWVQHASATEARTSSIVALFLVAAFVLVLVARPLEAKRLSLVAAMVGAGLLLTVVPFTNRIFALALPPASLSATVGAVVVPILVVLAVVLRHESAERRPLPRREPLPPGEPSR